CQGSRPRPALHSFPTRRSSDLVTLVPYLGASEEYKTKPTQHSVATLRGVGIQPDALVLRSKAPVPEDGRKKIALFSNVEPEAVRSEEHTSELQSRENLVCRLLL